ncbi:MAG: hypothetical protein ABTQ73_01800 [Caldilineales bacterium]
MRATVSTKTNLIAAYYFLFGGFFVLSAIAAIFVPLSARATGSSAFLLRLPDWFLALSLLGIGGLLAVIGIGSLAIGWGLWQLKPWGRLWAMIAAVLQMPLIPLGPIAGGAILYVLLQDQTRDLFLG